jgi:hypothetical protein
MMSAFVLPTRTYPEYFRQICAYARMVGRPNTRCALLFTETGELCWAQ